MISIKQAQKIISENLPSRVVESIKLTDSLGRVLAEDITAPEPSPRFTNSAMDGFAARWTDVQSATKRSTVSLPIVGESGAGTPFKKKLDKGQVIRISTGAMIPDGADTVIPQEDTKFDKKAVNILNVGKKYQNIRFKGSEFSEEKTVLKKGTVIQSPKIGLLSALGIINVSVFRKPKVAIIVTGTEIKPFSSKIQPWQIRDSNSVMLKTAVIEAGGESALNNIVNDDLAKTRLILNEAMQKVDIIILSGGVSVGPHDLVKAAAEESGFLTLFWRVNQKPGKPLFSAKRNSTLLFGLPGNPVSAYMCYLLYVKPILNYMLGKKKDGQVIKGQLKEALHNNISRDHLMRVKIKKGSENIPWIIPLKKQGSHMLTSLTDADGFILVKSNESLKARSILEVNLF